MQLITQYPLWFTVFCIALGLLYAFVLYRNDRQFEELKRWKIRLMATLRFIVVTIIAFLLLSPLIKTVSRTIEQPVVLFVQDNSESILIHEDTTNGRFKNYPQAIRDFLDKFSSNYELETYSFGDHIQKGLPFSFSDKETDFSALFSEIKSKYTNRNVGALIVASDGIYNQGVNPLYPASELDYPVYTIGLGDTSRRRDMILTQVRANKIAFLGNRFPIQTVIEAHDMQGTETELNVYNNGQSVFTKKISINSAEFTETVDIELEAKATGLQRYAIRLTPNNDEVSHENNAKDIIIEIIDSKQKILLLANSPHPDLGALKFALERNPNFLVDYSPVNEFEKNVQDYNLVVLHQLPSKTNSATQLLSQIKENQIPALFILGSQTAFPVFNSLETGLEITPASSSLDEAQAIYNEQFTLFEVKKETQDFSGELPPLLVPFGEYKLSNTTGTNVLFHQKIRNINNQQPLVLLVPTSPFNENKTGIIAGEGLWRWRIYDYRENKQHQLYNDIVNKLVQYLALQLKKERFVLSTKNVFNENEAITFEAEVYNESYELIDDATVSIQISNAEGKQFEFVFAPDKFGTKTYFLNAGVFPVGDYTYEASVEIDEKNYTKNGSFSVLPINFESINTRANHQMLYQLASQSNGRLFFPDELDSLFQQIKTNKDIVPVSYTQKSLRDVIHLKWIFFLILVLISVEWFFRKFNGGY